MSINTKVYNFFIKYLNNYKKDFVTKDFAYSSYNPPNTMFEINNDLPEILIQLDYTCYKVYLRSLSLLKRNHDPAFACSFVMDYKYYTDIIGRTSFFKAKKKLIDEGLLIKTPNPSVMIVHIKYANKLFKPKFELE